MRLHLTAALATLLMMGSPALAQDTVTADTVVATVNGKEITVGHMVVARERLPEQYRQLPDDVLFKGILDQLVQQEALRTGREGLSKRSLITIENEQRSLQVAELIQEAVDAAITEDAIEAAYSARFGDTEPEDEFSAAHILVETEAEALEIVSELEGGADFAELARQKSTDLSGPNGGDLGWFGKGMTAPEFEAAVLTLEAGAISAPVKTEFGWHVIRLNEVRQKEAPSLEEARNELVQQIQRETVNGILETATDGADISRVAEGEIDASVLSNPALSFD